MSGLKVYTVAWICAIGTELVAAKQFLDETHDAVDQLPAKDDNAYVLGKVGKHNVVIAALPHGQYGLVSAAVVARDMARSFPNLRFALMVGIGGGAPSQRHDIRLGDIVVSSPDSGVGGVLQYDFGKTVQDESFKVTGHLDQSPQCLLRAIPLLEADYESDGNGIDARIARILETKPRLRAKYRKPELSTDRLFSPVYKHAGDKDQECTAMCNATHLVKRPERSDEEDSPTIHYGTIASANQLMKDANLRDKLSAENNVLCFEMEAAGLMNQFPCLVVRGICDYSDTHKNKIWQGYAAMAAVAYAKDLLRKVAPNRIEAERKLIELLDGVSTEVVKTKLAIQDQTQQQERRDQDDKDKKCLRDLLVTDPRTDKARIEKTKGGLLEGSYSWILQHDIFNQFRQDQHNRLLWIKGDPGKGKTMLLCGIIDQLQKDGSSPLCYFFCQATINALNNATSVLRGLIYHLVSQKEMLIQHVRKAYDEKGEKLFAGANVWHDIRQIATAILNDPSLKNATIIIDALDECTTEREQLLDFMIDTSTVRWIVSSRSWPDIEAKLNNAKHLDRLQLEVNQDAVTKAVDFFINYRVDQLARTKIYKKKETKEVVRRYLAENANGTFLWVALVCQQLEDPKVAERHTQNMLQSFPPGLDELYKRMIEHVFESMDAEICREILALVVVVYRPVTLNELKGLVQSIEDFDQDEIQGIIASCGSFLTLREGIVYFVHQSAKDFLLDKASDKILSSGIKDQHFKIFKDSLDLLDDTLSRDIYDLRSPGYPISKVETPSPDPLANMRYSCVYWVDHLQDAGGVIQTGLHRKSVVTDTLRFLKTGYLQWLEALSLMHNIPEGVKAIQKLERVLANSASEELQNLAKDARRFLLSQKGGIELAPLQTYTSALIFSPSNSLIKKLFYKEFPGWIDLAPKLNADWSACLQTIEGHSSDISSVSISTDGCWVASGSEDSTVKFWDAKSGICLQTLEGHSFGISSVAISTDGRWVASGSEDSTVKFWDAKSGVCLQTLEGHSRSVQSVSISTNNRWVASGSNDRTIKLWDAELGVCLQTFKGHSKRVYSVVFSNDDRKIASGSYDRTIKLWDAKSGVCLQTFKGHSQGIYSVAISTNGYKIASGSNDTTVKLWDAKSGTCLQTLKSHSSSVRSVAISSDGRRLASGSYDNTVRLWDAESGACLQTLEGHSYWVNSVAISTDGRLLVSGSRDRTVRFWDAESDARLQTLESHSNNVESIAIANDGRNIVSGSSDHTVKLWDAESGTCLQTLEGHSDRVNSVVISANGDKLASGSSDETVKLWDAESGACLQTLDIFFSVYFVAISADGRWVASDSEKNTIKLWDAESGTCLQTLEGHSYGVGSVAISPDGRRLASGSSDGIIKFWDAESGTCLQTLEGHSYGVESVAISPDGRRLASGSSDETVKLWDAESGACLQALDVGRVNYYLEFDPHHYSRLLSDTGDILFDSSSVDPATLTNVTSSSDHGQNRYGISTDNVWIVQNGRNLLWLPPEYRPSESRVAGSTIAIGCSSGRVWVIRFVKLVTEFVKHK